MIIYDGTALESVAPVAIEDIRVGPIELAAVTRPRAIQDGSAFVRMRGGTRTVAITFAILRQDIQMRQDALLAVSMWAKADKEYRLELPLHPGKYLKCVCTGKPEPSARQWWESKLRLTFTCFDDPYWIDTEEKSAACGTVFTVLGSAPPLMQIKRTLAASAANQAYSDGTNTITLTNISTGDLIIDLNRQTIQLSGNSIMNQYTVNSSFIVPRTGTMTISGTGTVYWRERWQ